MAVDFGLDRLRLSHGGAIAEILGIHIGLMLTIPGMFFELVLPFWLFIKGFQPEAYGGRAEVVMTPTVRPAPAALSPKERHAELTEASCENRRRPLPAADRHEVSE